MDQKNTIVKCNRSPKCLFEHNEVCDNYVINIGADGQCACYVETEESIFISSTCRDCEYFADAGLLQCPCDKHEQYVYRKAPACGDFKARRGQRAKCSVYDDASFNLCSAACQNYDFKGALLYCLSFQEYLGPEHLMKPCERFKKEE
jgi:hypothetical protein